MGEDVKLIPIVSHRSQLLLSNNIYYTVTLSLLIYDLIENAGEF